MSKADFLTYQAQTSPFPIGLQVASARGSYIYDTNGKAYLDFVAGVSANSVGHNHPLVNEAVKNQLDLYSHVMVYGEFIQKPQLELCKLLASSVNFASSIYLTNSGTEACEAALKLAKRVTSKTEIVAAKMSYHGNTQGSMSVSGVEKQNAAFRPLIPDVRFIEYNSQEDLAKITHKTAAVILETIQGGAGFIEPNNDYLKMVKHRCDEVDALLILDEIQTGIGRTGKFWGFENFHIQPDMIITGKGLAGGMPIGALIARKEHMDLFKNDPILGHITTFGGHPVIAAAGIATLNLIKNESLCAKTLAKEKLIRKNLKHPKIKELRGRGLMLTVILHDERLTQKVVESCMARGLILFFLLFEKRALRLTPPLTISEKEIIKGCHIILEVLDSF